VAAALIVEGFSEYEEVPEPLLCRMLNIDFREFLFPDVG
jgi:hypothetical protein